MQTVVNSRVKEGLTVTPVEYQQLKRLGLALIDKVAPFWPVIFVGIGRSPTPLMAFLECYSGPGSVIILPLSGFRHNYPGEAVPLLRTPLSAEQYTALQHHFQRFIPTENVPEECTWLVVDFVDSGASLAAATHYLRHYLRQHGQSGLVFAAALPDAVVPDCFIATMRELGLDYLELPLHESDSVSEPPFRMGRGAYYDPIAPVKRSFKIAEGHVTGMLSVDSAAYDDYRQQLAGFMFNDSDIETPLHGRIQTVIQPTACVTKTCHLATDANALHRQFCSFPRHVRSQLQGNTLRYPFVAGETLESCLLAKEAHASSLMVQLADVLAQVHWNAVITIEHYEAICTARRQTPPGKRNEATYGYFTRIHGDLHLRNLLVTPEHELVFIDRMRYCGDMLYDFPFMLSLLCFECRYRDGYFHHLAVTFFRHYERYIDEPHNFYRAFLVNFINYAHIAYETHRHATPPFHEWKHAGTLASAAAGYDDFKTFLLRFSLSETDAAQAEKDSEYGSHCGEP